MMSGKPASSAVKQASYEREELYIPEIYEPTSPIQQEGDILERVSGVEKFYLELFRAMDEKAEKGRKVPEQYCGGAVLCGTPSMPELDPSVDGDPENRDYEIVEMVEETEEYETSEDE